MIPPHTARKTQSHLVRRFTIVLHDSTRYSMQTRSTFARGLHLFRLANLSHPGRLAVGLYTWQVLIPDFPPQTSAFYWSGRWVHFVF